MTRDQLIAELNKEKAALQSRCAKLEAENAALREGDWQPIETAPKTGDVLIYCDDTKEQMVAFWHPRHDGWQFALDPHSGPHIAEPTHWKPLPAPPHQPAQSEGE